MDTNNLSLRSMDSFGQAKSPGIHHHLSFSRRNFLKSFSIAALATCPAFQSVASTISNASVQIFTSRNKAIFKLGTTTAWVIDTDHFGGNPKLKTTRERDRIHLELLDAVLPGTDISADFTCELKRDLLDWVLKLKLKALPFTTKVPLTEWLIGAKPALFHLKSGKVLGNVCKELTLSVSGNSFLKFNPDWQLEIISNGRISLVSREVNIDSSYAGLRIPQRDDPSCFADRPEKRSIIELERENRLWQLGALLPSTYLSNLQIRTESFDHLTVEAIENRSAGSSGAIIACSYGDEPIMDFIPDKSPTGIDGKCVKIPLRNVSSATTVGGTVREAAVQAKFGSTPINFTLDGYIIETGYAEGVPPFELVVRNNQVVHQRCEPALLKAFTVMSDALTGPMLFPDGSRLSFADGKIHALGNGVADKILGTSDKNRNRATSLKYAHQRSLTIDADFQVEQDDPSFLLAATTLDKRRIVKPTVEKRPSPQRPKTQDRSKAESIRPAQPGIAKPVRPQKLIRPDLTVPVLRPEDFLSLTFQFYNLRLDPAGGSSLIRKDAGAQAYIALQFPPQSIVEEALFEEETSKDPAKALPVQSRISGPSRLVFRVPKEVQSIPYSLKDLLAACSTFHLRVPATALPPPPEQEDTRSIRPTKALLKSSKGGGKSSKAFAATSVPGPLKTNLKPDKLSFRPGGPEKGKPPGPLETVIEMPYRLWLSPHSGAAWTHSLLPAVGHRNRIELWHTRLATHGSSGIVDEDNDYYRTLRAVWSPDYDQKNVPEAGSKSFLTSLDALDRHEIVALTSDFRISGYTPLPIWAKRMILTSYGAWLDSRGSWDPPCDQNARKIEQRSFQEQIRAAPRAKLTTDSSDSCPTPSKGQCSPGIWLNVEEWRHRATMGREHYVRVVYKGYLFPFGHRASLIKITERKFRAVEEGPLKGKIAAYLHQREFIVVRQPVLHYPILDGKDRLNPFRKITITTLTTPNLDKPAKTEIETGSNRQAFWVYVSGEPFLFSLIGEDWRGAKSDFTAPVIFLDQSKAKSESFIPAVISEYKLDDQLSLRKRDWNGQSVAFAEISNSNPLATTLDTHSITFGADKFVCNEVPGDRPLYFPVMDQAEVRIPAVEALSGGALTRIQISKLYEDHGFGGKNAQGEIYARVVDESPLIFDADQAGGLATPNINIAGLSRAMGPVGGEATGQGEESGILANFGNGTFNPEDFFKGAADEAMILGGIKLFELFSTDMSSEHAPKMENKPIYKGGDLQAVETTLIWEPPLKPRVKTFNDLGGKAKFKLEVLIVNSLDGNPSESSMRGILTDFSIDLLADLGAALTFIIIDFASFEFISISGSKTEVNPVIRDVRFAGALKYVNELSKFLPCDGMNIDVTPAGVTAGLNLAIPAITSGVMTLQNISLSAGITLPFSGDPMRVRFAFCERNNPFLLTIYGFGGGGYVGLSLGLDSVEQLEMAFEFGASCALDIGVASGGVEVMAGIYILADDEGCQLSGYLRMSGELSVLAIVRLSIEFYMTLSHDTKTNKTWGECNLTVEIEVVFFSASVSLHVRREFSEPTYLPFREMMTQDSWTSYCQAFA